MSKVSLVSLLANCTFLSGENSLGLGYPQGSDKTHSDSELLAAVSDSSWRVKELSGPISESTLGDLMLGVCVGADGCSGVETGDTTDSFGGVPQGGVEVGVI